MKHHRIKKILSRSISFIIWKLFRVEVIGRENVPTDSKYIIVSNHSSKIDSFLLNNISKNTPRFLVNELLYDNWYFFILGFIFNIIPLRHNKDLSAFKECINTLERRNPIVIFPEGKLSLSGDMGTWQKGAEFIAKRTDSPILPVVLVGANRAWSPNSYLPRFCKIQIHITRIISPHTISLTEEARNNIDNLLTSFKLQ